ncbi:MAG: thiamine pyrophosphate-dependent enzyme [Tepidanaerobacteraceae bacterium]|jgi:2-oxoglutarate ferredoxin oxidoreductase subunit beta|nr:thiamine pyrophosphate-dependent enzyme [Tepidanaerobacteraceae bacterium]
MKKVIVKPKVLHNIPWHYCPGCTHGIVHRLIAEVIDEMDLQKDAVGVASVGCSCFNYDYFDIDMSAAAHGRAPAVATGIKRVQPGRLVFTYQGDGDLCAIGTAEAIHAAVRGENITIIFYNNGIYGMTGGQMAPTSLPDMKTTTSPYGRNVQETGFPIKMTEMLALQEGCVYAERTKVSNPASINKTKKAIRKAFELQLSRAGFTIVEILGTCPTNWGLDPLQAIKWMEEKLEKQYPTGILKNSKGDSVICDKK